MAQPLHQFPKEKLCIGFLAGQPTRYMLVYKEFQLGILNFEIQRPSDRTTIRLISVVNIEQISNKQAPKVVKSFLDSAKRMKPADPQRIQMKLDREPGDATIFTSALAFALSTQEVLYFAFNQDTARSLCDVYNYQINKFKEAARKPAPVQKVDIQGPPQRQQDTQVSLLAQSKDKQDASPSAKNDQPASRIEPPKTTKSKIWCVSYNTKQPTREVIAGLEKRGNVTLVKFSSGNKFEAHKATFDVSKVDSKLEKRIQRYEKRGHKELAKIMKKSNLKSENQVCLPDSQQFEDVHAAIFKKLVVFEAGKQALVYGFKHQDAQQVLAVVNKPPAKENTEEQHYAVHATSLDQQIKCVCFDAVGYSQYVVQLTGCTSDRLRFQLKPLCSGGFENIEVDEIEQSFVGSVNQRVKQCQNQLGVQIFPFTLVNQSQTVAQLAFFDNSWAELCKTELDNLRLKQQAVQHSSIMCSDGINQNEPSAEPPQVQELAPSVVPDLLTKDAGKTPSPPLKQKKQTAAVSQGQSTADPARQLDKPAKHAERPPIYAKQQAYAERVLTKPSEQIVAVPVTPNLASANLCLINTKTCTVRGYFKVVAIDGKKILLLKTCFQKFYQTVDIKTISAAKPTLELVNQQNQQRLAFKQLIERGETIQLDSREQIGAFDFYIFKEVIEVCSQNNQMLVVFVEERLVNDLLASFQ